MRAAIGRSSAFARGRRSEDKAGWSAFLKHLKDRGLKGIRLITSDACIGLAESAAEFFPETVWQRCAVLLRLPGAALAADSHQQPARAHPARDPAAHACRGRVP